VENFWRKKKVLVTGGAGFVGSFVVERLIKYGASVTITSRSSSESLRNIAHLDAAVNVLAGDLLDSSFVDTAIQGQDIVFHLASYKKNIAFHQKYPADILRINTILTMNVLESARKYSVERVLMTSSGIVYGSQAHLPNKEEDGFLGEVEQAHYGYAWSKRISEVFSKAYAEQSGMKIAIARPYNIFGPRDNFDRESAQVIPTFINRVLAHENPFVMWGDGNQERSFLYVEDLARGLIDLTEKYPTCDPVNFGTDEVVKLKDLARMIMDIDGVDLKIEFDLTKPGGLAKRNCDNAKNVSIIGFVPEFSLKEGLIKTVEWYKNNVTL
jgi:GDP-L-fucose synthase